MRTEHADIYANVTHINATTANSTSHHDGNSTTNGPNFYAIAILGDSLSDTGGLSDSAHSSLGPNGPSRAPCMPTVPRPACCTTHKSKAPPEPLTSQPAQLSVSLSGRAASTGLRVAQWLFLPYYGTFQPERRLWSPAPHLGDTRRCPPTASASPRALVPAMRTQHHGSAVHPYPCPNCSPFGLA